MRITIVVFLLLSLLVHESCQKSEHYDIVIIGGEVYDGISNEPQSIDIGIVDDRIIRLGQLSTKNANRVINAKGLVVAPGFIDLHEHLENIREFPYCENFVKQGVTTALGGPDGGGPWPFGAELDSIASTGIGINAGFLVGHNRIRTNIMQLEDRAPTASELEQMKSQVETAMKEGAFGISTGLKYLPGTFSKTEEVISLSKVAAAHGGFYTSHLRDEGLRLLESVNEAILIGSSANIPVVLTHHKIVGKPMWGSSVKTLALVDSARKAGQDVMLDQYPYTASRTDIDILIPSWALEGGDDAFMERVRNPMLRDSMKAQVIFNIINDRGGSDLERVRLSEVKWDRSLENKTLYAWCVRENMEPTFANGAELVIRAKMNGGAKAIYHAMDDEDVNRIMQCPFAAVASDGILTSPGKGFPHPRANGTFPRVLARYVRETGLITLNLAIKKMTSLPASRMGLTDRGSIKEGMFADIVVFDASTVSDESTFDQPHSSPKGISFVIINGQVSVDEGVFKKIKPGKVLHGPGKK